MTRYFTTFSSRAKAYIAAHAACGRDGAATLYVVPECQPPMFLVGPPTVDFPMAGAEPLVTITKGLPLPDNRLEELEATVALVKDQNAELQRRLAVAANMVIEEYHLSPDPCRDCAPGIECSVCDQCPD